jgi:hypothetical protein
MNSAQFPVNTFDFVNLIRREGQLLEPFKTDYFQVNNTLNVTPFANVSGLGSFRVPPGRAFYVTSVAHGGAQVYRHQAGVTPFSEWGLSGVDPNTGEPTGANFQGGGLSTTLVPGMILFEMDVVQFAATNFTDFPARAFGSIVGIDFTGGTGLNFGASKVVATFGGSTTWKLKGDMRTSATGLPTYRYLTNDAGSAKSFMMPDLRGWTATTSQTYPPYTGEVLWTERLLTQMIKDGKSVRRVGLEFGGSSILRSWYGAFQKRSINTVPKIDLYLCEFGANDASLSFNDGDGATLAWPTKKRDIFKTRLAKFIEHRDTYNPTAPVVFISPVLLDDDYTNSNSRTYQDAGANGQYGGVSMTRIEIARRLVQEVANDSFYGGGTANNVYYINGLDSCGLGNVANQDYVPFYINDSIINGVANPTNAWLKQVGLRHASYNVTNGAIAYDAGYVPPPDSETPGTDAFDMFFKYTANGTNEQATGQRVHTSAMHDEAHFNNIYDKISGYNWYADF